MNIELLEEIEELKSRDISDTDIANMIGISKANMLLMLRIKRVVENITKERAEQLERENETLKEQLATIKAKLPKIDNIDQIIEQNKSIPDLEEEILDLRDQIKEQQYQIESLDTKLSSIPDFIKRFFAIE